jgi:hypothetical protein
MHTTSAVSHRRRPSPLWWGSRRQQGAGSKEKEGTFFSSPAHALPINKFASRFLTWQLGAYHNKADEQHRPHQQVVAPIPLGEKAHFFAQGSKPETLQTSIREPTINPETSSELPTFCRFGTGSFDPYQILLLRQEQPK